MFQFLFLLLCAAILIFSYRKFSRTAKSNTTDSHNGQSMLQLTSTNNSYDSLGDVFTMLDNDLAQAGLTLNADMRGYMDGI